MKITKTQLKQLIKEELKTVIDEGVPGPGAPAGSMGGVHTAAPPGWRTGPGIPDMSPQEAEAVKEKIGPDKLQQVMSGVGSAAEWAGIGAVEFLNFLIYMATAGGISMDPPEYPSGRPEILLINTACGKNLSIVIN